MIRKIVIRAAGPKMTFLYKSKPLYFWLYYASLVVANDSQDFYYKYISWYSN